MPTVFEGYPSYLAPSAKKPHRNSKARDPIPPRKPAKWKTESEECAVLESPEGEAKHKASTCTQTTHNDAQGASRYLSLVARLRSQAAYHRSEFSKAQQQLEAERKVISSYRDDKHYASVKKIAADAEKGEKKAVFLLHQIEGYEKKFQSYPEEVIRECVIWRFLSPKGYDHARAEL